MDNVLRFNGSVAHDQNIDFWLAERGELGLIAGRWFDVIRSCGDGVLELLHDGHPTACVGDAAFAYVNTFKAHANVGFFRGALLNDPAGLLEGSGRLGRHVKLRPGSEPDPHALEALIRAAYQEVLPFA